MWASFQNTHVHNLIITFPPLPPAFSDKSEWVSLLVGAEVPVKYQRACVVSSFPHAIQSWQHGSGLYSVLSHLQKLHRHARSPRSLSRLCPPSSQHVPRLSTGPQSPWAALAQGRQGDRAPHLRPPLPVTNRLRKEKKKKVRTFFPPMAGWRRANHGPTLVCVPHI